MIRLLAIGLWMGNPAAPRQEQEPLEKIVIDLGGEAKLEFVRIKAGTFTMRNDAHIVVSEFRITDDFWMQTTETTQAQWEAVLGKNPSHFRGADLPVETVSCEDCREVLKKLTEKVKDQLKGKTAGLPTEAQWEWACRAGEKGKWCFGDDEKKVGGYAWYRDNSDKRTHPVGQKKPNAWGLYDVHGNVWEWCRNPDKPRSVTDPSTPVVGSYPCPRGGCWRGDGNRAQSANRGNMSTLRDECTGLRVVLR